jgi:membrane protein DedA with SNARE-associated domain
MAKETYEEKSVCEPTKPAEETTRVKKSMKRTYIVGIIGVVLTVAAFTAIIVFNEEIREMREWGYVGAFVISILGGATIIIPVPMLAVVFALGGAMDGPWQVALLGTVAAIGEVIGGLTIYMTGHGAGQAISTNKNSRLQKAYERMLGFIRRRGAIALFLVTFIVNPFFYPAAFACGALRMEMKKFILVVIAGKIIKCMTIVYAGYFGLKGILRAFGIQL